MEITLTLDPGFLSNPDADLRYTIPDMVESISNKSVVDDGCDYDDEDKMIIYMRSDSTSEEEACNVIVKVCNELRLEDEVFEIETHA